eukprot:24804-Amphidinium_carterae.1
MLESSVLEHYVPSWMWHVSWDLEVEDYSTRQEKLSSVLSGNQGMRMVGEQQDVGAWHRRPWLPSKQIALHAEFPKQFRIVTVHASRATQSVRDECCIDTENPPN